MENKLSENSQKVLITGGSGLIGRYLTSVLLSEGFNVAHLSRKRDQFGKVRVFRWDPEKGILDPVVFEGVDYIIHLAGANIGEEKWSTGRKKEIANSRIDSANLLYNLVAGHGIKIKAFISASAIGYYGAVTSDRIFEEKDPPAGDFPGTICKKWEEAADQFAQTGTRTVKIRSAVVLDKNDGALSKFLAPARFGLFPRLGSGRQYIPWIHPEDLCRIYLKAVQDETMKGIFNAVSPHHVTQAEFMKILAKILNKPCFSLPVPSVFLKAALGEMAIVTLRGSRINPEKIIKSGFIFKFTGLEAALSDVLERNG